MSGHLQHSDKERGAFRTARVFMSKSQPAIALLLSDLKPSAGQGPIVSLKHMFWLREL